MDTNRNVKLIFSAILVLVAIVFLTSIANGKDLVYTLQDRDAITQTTGE